MATAPSANDLTRQQLDELDDLLQRMLNLPLTGTEPPPPAAPAGPTWRYDAPAAPPAPAPHLVTPPEPPRPPAVVIAPPPPAPAVRLAPPPRPEPVPAPVPMIPPPEPTIPIIERKPTPPSRPAPKPAAPVAVAPPPVAPPPAPAPVAVETPAPPLPVVLWPLAAIDWVYDGLTRALGPVGWLLRSWFGKNLIGLAGVALLVYTAAHLATEAGWIHLPFPVPWPR